MNERIQAFVNERGPVFCLDIGSGTQDALLALPDTAFNNWPRWVIPSPARMISTRIRQATREQRNIWLYGDTMGGGFQEAVQAHIKEGYRAYATENAAKSIHDNLKTVQAMGVEICEHAPKGAMPLRVADFEPGFWTSLFANLGLPSPNLLVASAQDHGFSLTGNRKQRMETWEHLLRQSNAVWDWIYTDVPPQLTRLRHLQNATGGCVADTGTSALLAFLCDPNIVDRSFQEGLTLVNCGNTHILAALFYRGRICGLYEQHTKLMDFARLDHDLHDFRLGWLPNEQVQAAFGHGTAYSVRPQEAGGFEATFVTGPQREMFTGLGRFINPCGDMMTAGCFGLLLGMANASH